MLRLISAALALCAITTNAWATQDLAPEEPEGCWEELYVDAAMVRDASFYDLNYHPAATARPALITGYLSPTRDETDSGVGAAVFVQEAPGQWRGFLPRPQEGITGMFGRADGGLIIVTQWQSEGPGQTWTLVHLDPGMENARCVEVDFPDTLNQPSWNNDSLDLIDLDIAANGRGEIIGMWRKDDDSQEWYVYRTRDHGASWSAPRKLSRERAVRAGAYTEFEEADAPAELVADLTAFAATRGNSGD